jgi:transposase InsO family protein
VQLDIQELPAIRGQRGREYKISLIDLRTRMKYSEITRQATSAQVAAVLERSLDRLPPFHLVVTDNAMVFTMAYSAHPQRKRAFEQTIERLGLRHWRIPRGSPWCNGFIERSNRTDNEECFHQYTFSSPEERQYIDRLWEMYYNSERPHQGLDGHTPLAVFHRDYPIQAAYMGTLTL